MPVRPPASGTITAVAALPGPGRRLVAVAGTAVVTTVDGGARWQDRAAVEPGEESTCGPVIAASGDFVVVVSEQSLLWSDDEGRSFQELPTPFESQPCSVAIVDGPRVAAVDDGALVTIVLEEAGPTAADRRQPPFEATLVAAAAGVTALAGEGMIFVRRAGASAFSPVLYAGSRPTVRALAVDRSGDLWFITSAGLFVVGPAGGLRTVLRRSMGSSELALAASDGDVVYLLQDGELGEVRGRCPCAAGAPVPLGRAPARRGRPVAAAGLLPAVELTVDLGRGRQRVWLALSWPLPSAEAGALSGWQELAVGQAEEWTRRQVATAVAERRRARHRVALEAPWPPPDGWSSVRAGVSALAAERESALWRDDAGVVGPPP